MRVFKLLQDLPDVQAGELFIAREIEGAETFFSNLADKLRYDFDTVVNNPVWFVEVEAVHAEFEQIKQEAKTLLSKLEGLQKKTPDHVDLTPSTSRVSNVVTHLTQVQPLLDHPTTTLPVENPNQASVPVEEAVPVPGTENASDPQLEVVQPADVPVEQTEPADATSTGAEDQGLDLGITPKEVDPELDALNDAEHPSQAPEAPAPIDIPVAPDTTIPSSVQETVEAPALPEEPVQPVDPVDPPIITNIEPNPFA